MTFSKTLMDGSCRLGSDTTQPGQNMHRGTRLYINALARHALLKNAGATDRLI